MFLKAYLSPKFLLNFPWNLYIPPWLGENDKFMVFTLLKNAFASKKIKSTYFRSCLTRQNISPGFYLHTPDRGKPLIPPQGALFKQLSPPAEREGEETMKLSGYIVNAGRVNKGLSKAFGGIIINSISNFSCTMYMRYKQRQQIHRDYNSSRSSSALQGGAELADFKPKSVK